jgi:regulator of replication initiation timing
MDKKIQHLEEEREAVGEELWSTSKTRELSETTHRHRDTAASSVPEVNALQSRIAELVEENEGVITENKRLAEESEAIRAKADALLAAAKDTLETFTREKKEMDQNMNRNKKTVVVKSEGDQVDRVQSSNTKRRSKNSPSPDRKSQYSVMSSTWSRVKTDGMGKYQRGTGMEVVQTAEAVRASEADRYAEESIPRQLIAEKNSVVDENKSLMEELKDSRTAAASREIAAESRMETLRNDMQTLGQKLAEMEDEKSTLLAELSRLRQLEKQRGTLQSTVEQLMTEKDTLVEENKSLQDEVVDVQAMASNLVAVAQAELETFCLEKEFIDQRVVSVEQANETLKKEILELRCSADEMEMINTKLQSLEAENGRLAAENQNLETRLFDTQSKANSLVSVARAELELETLSAVRIIWMRS